MAVTKIWPVKGRLDAVIRYAGNEEKTRLPDLTGLSASKDDLNDVLQYAANDAKTTRENQLFVSGVNCVPEIARQQMELTKQQFGKTGGTVAFHAYQSFRPGEVTPEQCHAIGLELAKRVWGDRFQVLVATHLNTDCCHNHFVINSVSFVDGKRYNDCKRTYRALQDASDQLCREQGLSVVDKKDAHRVPRNLYLAEKAGEPTRYNVMRQDIDLAILRSETPRDLPHILRKMGYEVDFNPNHKYPTIKLPHDRRAVRFKTLGEEYTPQAMAQRIQQNHTKCRNRLRRCRDPTECEALHAEKDELTKQITETRKELKTAQQIPSRVKRMQENIQLLNDREQQRAAHRKER